MIYYFLLNDPSLGDINLINLSCLISALRGDTSESWNSSIFLPFGETIFTCFFSCMLIYLSK